MALKFTFLKLQWNPVNPVTNRPQTFGRINGVAVLKGFSKYEND